MANSQNLSSETVTSGGTSDRCFGIKMHVLFNAQYVIGASLSKPNTSVTAFAEVVCMYVCLRPYTVNFK